MNLDIRNILDQIEDPDIAFFKQYLDKVTTVTSVSIIDAAKIGSEIYLALTLRSVVKDLENAINSMTESNETLAKANEKHASSLKWATWALVGATILLAIVAGIQVYLTYLSLQ